MRYKPVFVLSLILNLLFVLFLAFALSRNTASMSFLDLGKDSAGYLNSAFFIGVPAEGADIVFGPAEFSLRKGASASLQFSAVLDGKQSHLALEPLYDRDIVLIEPSGFGLVIHAIDPGVTVLQVFTQGEFRDIARITVYE